MPGIIIHKEAIVKINRHKTFRSHTHYDIELIMLLDGKYRVITDDGSYDMYPGDIFTAFPFEPHAYECIGDVKPLGVIVIISPDNLGKYKRYYTDFRPKSPVIKADGLAPGFGDNLRRIAELAMAGGEISYNGLYDIITDPKYESRKVSAEVIMSHLVASLGELAEAYELAEHRNAASESIGRIMMYISTHFRDCELSMKSLCDATGISRSQVSRLLSGKLDTSFSELVHRIRISEARRLLAEGDKTSTEVAFECGFSSQRTFNRVFIDLIGMTPSEFRREIFENRRHYNEDTSWK